MKKIFTGMIAIAALTFSASAQTQRADETDRGGKMREGRSQGDRMHPRLLEQLDLTDTQKEQIKVINDDYRSKMQELIKSDIVAEDRKAKRMGFESERTQKIMVLLTPEQIRKLKELQASKNQENNKGEYKEKIKTEDGKMKIKVKSD